MKTVNKFYGLAPRYNERLFFNYARTAVNTDLSSGRIRPFKKDKLLSSGHSSDFCIDSSGKIHSGNNDYIRWPINSFELVISLSAGTAEKKVSGTISTLGQALPGKPAVSADSTGVLSGKYKYFITFVRSTGGYEDESGPSTLSDYIEVTEKQIKIERPSVPRMCVAWNIYRISNDTSAFQFVERVSGSQASYTDNKLNEDLSGACPTYFTSDQGNSIAFSRPPKLTGIAGVHAGMLFGWSGSTLYWSEPGVPDAWPAFYNMNFPSDILCVVCYGGAVAVLCKSGAFRVEGTHPELMQQFSSVNAEPCLNTKACITPAGIAFLCDSGVAVFNLYETSVISNKNFTEAWFKENVYPGSAVFAYNDNLLSLFHSNGALHLDFSAGKQIWFSSLRQVSAAYKHPEDGELYIRKGSDIYKFRGSSESEEFKFRSGDLFLPGKSDVLFESVSVRGSGSVLLNVFIGGKQVASKGLEFDMDRNRRLKIPFGARGENISFEVSGTGNVDEVTVI